MEAHEAMQDRVNGPIDLLAIDWLSDEQSEKLNRVRDLGTETETHRDKLRKIRKSGKVEIIGELLKS